MAVSINIGTNTNPAGLTCWSAKRRRGSAALPCPCANVVSICYKTSAVQAVEVTLMELLPEWVGDVWLRLRVAQLQS